MAADDPNGATGALTAADRASGRYAEAASANAVRLRVTISDLTTTEKPGIPFMADQPPQDRPRASANPRSWVDVRHGVQKVIDDTGAFVVSADTGVVDDAEAKSGSEMTAIDRHRPRCPVLKHLCSRR
jgi:hypothetical protein